MPGAKLNPEHWLPAVQPRCLQSPEIRTWKSGLTKYSGSDIQGTRGGSYYFQKNRVGTAPRQGIAPFHQSGSHSNIWHLMKKIVAEAKKEVKCNSKAAFSLFPRWNCLPEFPVVHFLRAAAVSSSALEMSVYSDTGFASMCLILDVVLQFNPTPKPSLALCTCSQCY